MTSGWRGNDSFCIKLHVPSWVIGRGCSIRFSEVPRRSNPKCETTASSVSGVCTHATPTLTS